jgi:hypothetical protein
LNFKLNLCKKVVAYISNSTFNINLGIILDNYDSIFKIIYKLNYDIYCVGCYSNNKYLGNFILNVQSSKTTNKNETNYGYNFRVTASLTPDIYNLYILDNNKEIFYEYALIDSYKTSVFMNDLFRKIKENKNLDLLEESDDEEEFENIDLEKYVNLGKTYIIECFYNKKFKKWVPKNLAKNNYINFFLKSEALFLELERIKDLAEKNNLKDLSMGMSNDYEDALLIGSTWVRIGSKIFSN